MFRFETGALGADVQPPHGQLHDIGMGQVAAGREQLAHCCSVSCIAARGRRFVHHVTGRGPTTHNAPCTLFPAVPHRCGGVSGRELTDAHLETAKDFLRRKFVVGLTSEMAESWRRFRSQFGWTGSTDPDAESCVRKMTEAGGGVNRNDGNRGIEKGSAEWDAVASLNDYDVRLYEYTLELFRSGA